MYDQKRRIIYRFVDIDIAHQNEDNSHLMKHIYIYKYSVHETMIWQTNKYNKFILATYDQKRRIVYPYYEQLETSFINKVQSNFAN